MLRVGLLLYGYCSGQFDGSYKAKRVEAIGADWVVAREIESGRVCFYEGDPEQLMAYCDPLLE